MGVASRGRLLLDRWSRGARVRSGTTSFLHGSQAASDRALSALYFSLASGDWGGVAVKEGHLAPFDRGLQLLPDGQYDAILDLGTGAGGSAGHLAACYPQARVLGVDRSRRMIREAGRLFDAPNLSFQCCDAVHPPWPDGSFDLITSHNFIPYPPEVHRLLRPGGVALVSGTFEPLQELNRLVWEAAGFHPLSRENVGAGSAEVYRRD
jgi:SAM-dependent methyltransferase